MLTDDVQLVSVNDHLIEPADLWTSRVHSGGPETVPHVAQVDGVEYWRIGGYSMPVPEMAAMHASGERNVKATRYADVHTALLDPHARLAAMDQDRVAVHTVWPSVVGFAGERLRYLGDAAAWLSAVRTYNDWLIGEWCAITPRRLVPVAMVPLSTGAVAAAEAERAADLGARALAFPHNPPVVDVASFYSGEWSRLWAVAEHLGLPIMIHIGKGVGVPENHTFGSAGALLTDMNFDVLASLVDVVFSRVLVDHPRLKVAFIEGGASWLPYIEERMDFFLKRPGVWDPELALPSVLARRTWASLISDPNAIAWREQIGVERLLWQSDFAHSDGFWPHSREHLAAELAQVADADARRIGEDNARGLLNLPR